jgi:hypothetical protein
MELLFQSLEGERSAVIITVHEMSVCDSRVTTVLIVTDILAGIDLLTLSDPMSDLVRHYDFPVPDAFLDL